MRGRPRPLNGRSRKDKSLPFFANFACFATLRETVFLVLLRNAVVISGNVRVLLLSCT